MKRVYDIKIKSLYKLLKLLKKYDNDSMVEIDILRLESYINRFRNNFCDKEEPDLFEELFSDIDFVRFYRPFYCFSKEFSSIGVPSKTFNVRSRYTSFHMSDSSVMENAESFFAEQGEFFHSSFLDFKSEAFEHLKFIKPNQGSDGETLMLKSTREAFVFSPNYSNITKFTILIHELEHVIDFFNNPDFFDSYPIRETAAVFMELIACDFIAKKYNLESDSFTRKRWIHQIVKMQAEILDDKLHMLDLASSNKKLNNNELLDILERNGFEMSYIEYLLEATISEDFSYQLPYFIAVELYIIYKRDKCLALGILEDIIINGTQDNILFILKKYNIEPNRNIADYEKILFAK